MKVSVVERDRRAEGKACDDDTEQNPEAGHHGSLDSARDRLPLLR